MEPINILGYSTTAIKLAGFIASIVLINLAVFSPIERIRKTQELKRLKRLKDYREIDIHKI
jgi:hypothetical protein